MNPERGLDTVMHLWQNIVSYVMPYCEKAEHVVEDGVKNYALPPVQNSYNSMVNYAQSAHLFGVLTSSNEAIRQLTHRILNAMVNSEEREKLCQQCIQKIFYYISYIRDIIIAVLMFPLTLFWTFYSFVFAKFQEVLVLPQIITDGLNNIGVSKKTFACLLQAGKDMKEGTFDYKQLLYDIINGFQSLTTRYIKHFGRQSFVSRYIISYDVLGRLEKIKEKTKPTKSD